MVRSIRPGRPSTVVAVERELLVVFEPTRPLSEMTDDELDEFAEAMYDEMVAALDRRRPPRSP